MYAILGELRDITTEDVQEFHIFIWDKCCIPPFWRYKYSPEMFELMTDRYTLQGGFAELIHEMVTIEGSPEAWKKWVQKCQAKGMDFTEFWERREALIARRSRRENSEFNLLTCFLEETIIRTSKGKLFEFDRYKAGEPWYGG